MTWLDELLADDVRWSDGGQVSVPAGDERSARDVFEEFVAEAGIVNTELGPGRDVFGDLGGSLDRADFVETGEFAPIEASDVEGAEPLAGLLGAGDPIESLVAGSAPATAAPLDDITSLAAAPDDRGPH